MRTSGVVLGVQRGAYFWYCVRGAKRCIFLVLCQGCKEVHTSGVVLGVQRGPYFWCCVEGCREVHTSGVVLGLQRGAYF